MCIRDRGRLHETQLGLWEDKQTEGWKRLADAVHQYEMCIRDRYYICSMEEGKMRLHGYGTGKSRI